MRRTPSRLVFSCAVFAISFLVQEDVCLGQIKGAVSMDTQISQVEDSWNQGDRSNYYSKAAAIAKEIKANPSKTNLTGPASNLLASLLAKQANPIEVGTSDLVAMRDLASYLASKDDVPIANRRVSARLLCKYLGKIRKERVPNFTPGAVVENIAPPPGVPGFAGMSPGAIKDPAARAKYEQAIRENQDRGRQNSRQAELEGMEWSIRKKLKSYIPRTFKASDISSPAFVECMDDASFDDKERKEIESQLKRKGE